MEPAALTSSGTGNWPQNSPFFERTDWLSFGFTWVVVLVIYLWTLAPEVTLEFSGILSASAAYAGVAHPPGFPVWTLYSWLFVKLLPFSNIAWRVEVGSAVAASLACGLVALMVSRGGTLLLDNRLGPRRWKPADENLLRLTCGCVAAMAVGFSTPVWRDALKAEGWSLNLCLFAAVLCFFMRWMMRPERRRFLLGAVFAFGLLLTSNQELIVLTPALLLLVLLGDPELGRDLALPVVLLAVTAWVMSLLGVFWWLGSYYVCQNACLLCAFLVVGVVCLVTIVATRRFGSQWKPATLCGLVFLFALACYLYLPLASMTNPPMNWGYTRTVEGFFHALTRGQYERPRPTNELGPFIAQLWTMAKVTGKGLGWLYLPFAALPLCLVPWMERSARNWMLGLVALFVCTGPVMVATLSPAAERAGVDLVAPSFCPMYVVLAIWTGLGLTLIGGFVAKSGPRTESTRVGAIAGDQTADTD